MVNKSVVDTMTTDHALRSLRSLFIRNAISSNDAAVIVKHIMRRAEFTAHQIARLQSGLEMPDVMPAAIELVIADRELLASIKSLKDAAQ